MQVSQLANSVGRMEAQGAGKLPSQIVTNLKESVNEITLRGEKQLEDVHRKVASEKEEDKEKRDLPGILDESNPQIEVGEPPKKMPRTKEQPIVPTLSFPSRFSKSKEESEKEILETFKKVQVNIPLLDAIKQVPRYVKFLKELFTNKRKLRGDERRWGKTYLLCFIGNSLKSVRILGPSVFLASLKELVLRRQCLTWEAPINVILYSIFSSLNLGPLKETEVVITSS